MVDLLFEAVFEDVKMLFEGARQKTKQTRKNFFLVTRCLFAIIFVTSGCI
jgi:hypothetical protein